MNSQTRTRQNVLWIFGDQHRAQALSINGDPNLHTPNIDRLALTGMQFTNAVCTMPLCMPSRATLLTSRYPHQCLPGPENLPETRAMDPQYPTIADAFNEAGYHTAYFGKWHVGGVDEGKLYPPFETILPKSRGHFKQWIGYENCNSQWDCWVHGHRADGSEIERYRLPGYETDELANLLIDFISERGKMAGDGQNEPFFAVLSVQPPHDPYVAPAEDMARHNPADIKLRENVPNVERIVNTARRDLAGAYAQIENLDRNIGRIMEALARNGLYKNTHILFFSDHGDLHGSHGQFRKMSPYEESIRIPMIISGEETYYGRLGRRIGRTDVPINVVDIAPTTLGLCGIEPPEWMQGHDYSGERLEWRKNDKTVPESAFIESVHPLRHPNSVDKPWRCIVTRDGWKYVCFEGMEWFLFNLNEDPYEQVNLAHNVLYIGKKEELNNRLRRWIRETGDCFTVPEKFAQPGIPLRFH